MTLEEFDKRIEKSNLYQFMDKHKRVINIIQGLIIIGLLVGINMYVAKDFSIKKQIADNCGYETQTYKCICNEKYVSEYLDYQESGKLNISDYNGELVR